MNYMEPSRMSFQELQEEVLFHRHTSVEQKKTIIEKDKKIETQNIQIKVLTNTQTLVNDILKSTVPNATPEKQKWITKQVNDISKKLKDFVSEISNLSKDNLIESCNKMYLAAIAICNFIYDHIGEIVVCAALIAAAAIIVFDVVLLAACVINGTAISAEALTAGSGGAFIDFALINSLI